MKAEISEEVKKETMTVKLEMDTYGFYTGLTKVKVEKVDLF